MIAQALVLFCLPFLLVVAAGWDLTTFRIPNFLSLVLGVLFVVFVMVAGRDLSFIGWHLLAGLSGLLAGFILFALRAIGGGDAKLFAVVALWLGFGDLLPYAVLVSICGGVLTLALLVARQWPLPARLTRHAWVLALHDTRAGIPYGVALATAGCLLLPHTEIFRLAARA